MSDNKSKDTSPAIGIDLGTGYSCVSIYRNGNFEIIANEHGGRTTPSFVAFKDNEILVGNGAKNQAGFNPTNTISAIKRIIGLPFNNPEVQRDIKKFPFKVINKNNKPCVQVKFKGEIKEYSPEEISSMILKSMKKTAEAYLGEPVKRAVITVPARFGDAQRQATKDAATIAGLDCIRIINEPTSAALCYGLDKTKGEKNILVFDTGSGTHDVSILSLDAEDGVFEVVATSGDDHLGGEDLDNKLLEHCIQEFNKKYKMDVSTNKRSVARLKKVCESAKRTLSSSTTALIEVDSLFEGLDFSYTMSRAKFENMCMEVFRKCVAPVDDVLKHAKMDKSKIDEIVLVGGSTRIPKIQQMISNYFGGKKLCKSVNPDEAVAAGAAVMANALTGGDKAKEILLLDVCPLNLGIKTAGDIMTTMIERNTTVPTEKKNVFSTAVDNQPGATICILEGVRRFAKDCNQIGEFQLDGIPSAPRGIPQIEVTYSLNQDCMLTVTAVEKSSGISKDLTVKGTSNNFSKKELDEMVKEAEKYEEEDKARLERVNAKNSLETYVYQMKNMVHDEKVVDKLSEEDKQTINATAEEAISWLDEQTYDTDKDVFENKKKELEEVFVPIVTKLYQNGSNQPSTNSEGSKSGPKIEEVD